MNWVTYALLSALFAGMTALLAKLGIEGVPSNVATMVRTIVIVAFAVGIVLARGEGHFVRELSGRTWLFLVLSGVATGLSWLCYFAALKLGPISQVAPIDKLSFVLAVALGAVVLHEKVSRTTVVGIVLIAIGVLLTLPSVQEMLHKTTARSSDASSHRTTAGG